MSTRRTIGDHIKATGLRVHGPNGLGATSSWDIRIGKFVFDGLPLAEHLLLNETEPTKSINEMMGAAYALVGVGIEGEIRQIRSLKTRDDSTADFESTLVDGMIVRIEVCNLAKKLELKYLNALSAIGRRVNKELAKHPAVMAHSPYVVRFYGRVLGPKDFEPWHES